MRPAASDDGIGHRSSRRGRTRAICALAPPHVLSVRLYCHSWGRVLIPVIRRRQGLVLPFLHARTPLSKPNGAPDPITARAARPPFQMPLLRDRGEVLWTSALVIGRPSF